MNQVFMLQTHGIIFVLLVISIAIGHFDSLLALSISEKTHLDNNTEVFIFTLNKRNITCILYDCLFLYLCIITYNI